MRLIFLLLCFVLSCPFPYPALADGGRTLPPYPFASERRMAEGDREKARKLFDFAFQENRRLKWDECLAQQAAKRAADMARRGRFDHRDPETGRNPAWAMVAQCHRCTCAGENLARGYQSARSTHNALMESPPHRKNILDPRFQLLGVGCYDEICVELFAGF